MPKVITRKKSNAVRSDLYLPRESFAVQTTYVGSKGDIRHVIGIGPEYAPHGATADKTWVAYELLSPELPNQTGNRKRFSDQGLPVYHVSLTAFRFWARHVAVLSEVPATIQ